MQNNFDNNFLYKSNTIYEHLLEHIHSLYKKGRFENTLKCIQLTADYAWKVHTGRYTDGRIENIAFDIGQNLNNILKSQKLDNYRFNLPAITNKYKNQITMIILNEETPTDLEIPCPWIPCGTSSVYFIELTVLGLITTVPACGNHASKLKRRIFEHLGTGPSIGQGGF